MSSHTLYDKSLLCYTEPEDFTDIQGIGRNPMYKRYDSVYSVIDKHIPAEYKDFFAHPLYSEDDGRIKWYVKNWQETPSKLIELVGEERQKYLGIKDKYINVYNKTLSTLAGEDAAILRSAMKYIEDDFIFCYDNKVALIAWGMAVDTRKHVIKGSVMHDLRIKTKRMLRFDPAPHGVLKNIFEDKIAKIDGTILQESDLPEVCANTGYIFTGWDPNPVGIVVDKNMSFTATYMEKPIEEPIIVPDEPECVTCRFEAAEYGNIEGIDTVTLPIGSVLEPSLIPSISPIKGYKFIGWDKLLSQPINEDTVFIAQYEEVIPWYKKLWNSTWFRWLLRILLLLLLLLLLLWLFKDCACSRHIALTPGGYDDQDSTWIESDPNVGRGGIYNPENPYEPVPTPGNYDDILPPKQGVLPPLEDNPVTLPDNPGVIANRLNILMENTDKSILDLARAFKEEYPGDEYQVIYYDDVVKRMQIIIPIEERERLKVDIPSKFAPEFLLFVFDEALFEGAYRPNDPAISSSSKSWYLDAVNAFEGWDITMGSDSVVIAIIDNGFNINHPDLKGRTIRPYNVWEHNDHVYFHEDDHGTHVAGTALATADNGEGICGIAPKCRFIPVQIANQNDMMTTTSVLDGILYALYQGADVLNVSLGQHLSMVRNLDENAQKQLISSTFKEEERLWLEISRIAANHKATLVVSAGNDGVLAGIDPLQRPDNFIVVSAIDKDMNHLHRADFSNYGEYSTISAPGVDIYSSVREDGYISYQGTSMAAPIVTGAVALMKSLDKNLTSKQIASIMQETGLPVNGKVGKLLQIDKALMKVQSGDFSEQTPVPSTGDVEILLSWADYNDIDLMCTDPHGEMIWYSNKTANSGGQLEIDMNVEYPGSSQPIEHIYWPTRQAPNGTYNVYVKFYKRHQPGNSQCPFKVKVKYNSQIEQYEGVLDSEGEVVQVCSFTIGTPSSGNGPVQSDESTNTSDENVSDSNDRTVERLEMERIRLKSELERIESELARIRNLR